MGAGASVDVNIRLRAQGDSETKTLSRSVVQLRTETNAVISAYDRAEAALKRTDKEMAVAKRNAEALTQSEIRAKVAAGDYAGALAIVDRELKSVQPGTLKFNNLLTQQSQILRKVESDAQGGGASINGLVTRFGAGAAAFVSFGKAVDYASESFDLVGNLDQTQRGLNTLFGSVKAGNQVYADATKFGEKYQITQSEIAESVTAAARVIKGSNAGTEKTLEVLTRLTTLSPGENIAGASRALSELSAGQVTSLVTRFNLSRDSVNKLNAEIKAGADPVKVLDRYLNELGVTSAALSNRLEGPAGAQARLAKSSENVKIAFGNFLDRVGASKVFDLAARGLNLVADAADRLTGKSAEDVQFGALENAQNYSQYASQVTSGNEKIRTSTADAQLQAQQWGPIGQVYSAVMGTGAQATEVLSQSQFAAVQALQQYGYSTQQAEQIVRGLADRQGLLSAATKAVAADTTLDATAKQDLLNRMLSLAATTPALAAEVASLGGQFVNGSLGAADLQARIAVLEVQSGSAQSPILGLANAVFQVASASSQGKIDLEALTGATYDDIAAQLEASAQTERRQALLSDLNYIQQATAGGTLSAADAANYLAQTYGIEGAAAQRLILLTNELNKARKGGIGNANAVGAGIGNLAGASATKARQQAQREADQIAKARQDYYRSVETSQQTKNRLQGIIDQGKTDSAEYWAARKELDEIKRREYEQGRKAAEKAGKAGAKAEAKDERAREQEAAAAEKARYDLMSDQEKLAQKIRQSRDITLPESQRLEAEKEILDLNKKITDERAKQYRASLDAAKARIDDSQERRKEERELAQARRVLANPNASADQKAAARDRIAEIDIDRRIRAEEIAQKTRDAGGATVPGTASTTAGAARNALGGPFASGGIPPAGSIGNETPVPRSALAGPAGLGGGGTSSAEPLTITIPFNPTFILDGKAIAAELVGPVSIAATDNVGRELRIALIAGKQGGVR